MLHQMVAMHEPLNGVASIMVDWAVCCVTTHEVNAWQRKSSSRDIYDKSRDIVHMQKSPRMLNVDAACPATPLLRAFLRRNGCTKTLDLLA